MLKLKVRKGFTLIEALCSVFLFSILLLFAVEIKINEIKLNKVNYETVKYTYFLEAVKNELLSNTSVEQICSLQSSGKLYVSRKDIENDDSIIDVNSIFLAQNDLNKFPYIILHLKKKDGALMITLNMYVKFYGKEKVYTCTFTK
ncbi:prepilin-type N-terminal cleavage/methylation domain-containing protein [Clostridium neuense]